MKASMKTKRGVIGATVLAGVLAIGGFASTNTLVFDDSTTDVGFGEQNAEVVHITDIDYTLDTTDKSQVTAVVLTAAPFSNPNTDANVWFRPNQDATTAWIECDENPLAGGSPITCTFPAPVDVVDFGEFSGAPSDMQLVIAE